MTKILLIINPVSGRQKARSILYRVIDFLCRNNCKTTVFTTSRRGDATDIVKAHAAECDRIICCGGDGTLNEIFSGLVDAGLVIPVGYIPTGTSNDIARSLGFNHTLRELLEIALYGTEQNLDIGKFNDSLYFSYVTSFGLFTKVAYETPQWLKNSMGRASYIFYGLSEIADFRPKHAWIVADGVEIQGEFVFGSVSNSTVFGGMDIFPEGSISRDDGKFEVLLVKPVKRAKDLQAILQGMILHEYNEETVIFLTASELKFSFGEEVSWTVDGEYAGEINEVNIKNMHKSAKVLVSRRATT